MKQEKQIKELKGLFPLSHNIKIYIPSTFDINQKISTKKYVKKTLSVFSKQFGGATSYQAKGAWTSANKGLIVENITIVESFATTKQVKRSMQTILQYAIELKKELKQEAISLEYNNKLYFI
jgi:hypothetical protein